MYNFIARVFIWFFGLSALISAAAALALGMPIALVSTFIFLTGIGAVKIFLQMHGRERDIQPMSYEKLPRAFRRYLDEETSKVEQLGFEVTGDYQLYRQPLPLHSRAFLSHDATCFAVLAMKSGTRHYGFLTVFDDGTYFESCPLRDPDKRPADSAPLRFGYQPDATLEQLHDFHRRQVEAIESERDTFAMRFRVDQYPEIAEYGLRLLDWDLYSNGYRILRPKSVKERSGGMAVEIEDRELLTVG